MKTKKQAKVFFPDGKIETFPSDAMAYSFWITLPKGQKAAYRPAGDNRPVYSWDMVDTLGI